MIWRSSLTTNSVVKSFKNVGIKATICGSDFDSASAFYDATAYTFIMRLRLTAEVLSETCF